MVASAASREAPVPAPPVPGLWRQTEFLKLWGGQTVSLLGSQITPLALPLAAAANLKAGPAQMALLLGVQYIPATVFGLFAGVWVDRLRRRPIMVVADLVRAVVLLAVPVAAWFGVLRLDLLYLAMLLNGIASVFFSTAYRALLPAVVSMERLVEANGKLETTASTARIAGPGLAGALVQAVGAPAAVAVDGATFLVSALSVALVRAREDSPPPAVQRRHIWREIGEGLRLVMGNPYLRAPQLSSATLDVFWNALFAVYILYVTRTLGLGPWAIGVIFGVGSGGALFGSLVARRIAARLGVGPTMIVGESMVGLGGLLIPLGMAAPALALPVLVAAEAIQSAASAIYSINRVSLAQAVTPDRMRGRAGASITALGLGAATAGTALGGVLGERLGVPATVLTGAVGGLLAFLWLYGSPLRRLRDLGSVQPAQERRNGWRN